jgi:hypothetical protein
MLNPCGLIGAWGWQWLVGTVVIGRSGATEWCWFERLIVDIEGAGWLCFCELFSIEIYFF